MNAAMDAKTPETVYHYTDGRGIQGILGGTQWLTSIEHLNDSQEFSYARDLYLQALDELKTDPSVSDSVRAGAKNSYGEATVAVRNMPGTVFVASYSTAPDALGQWRGYSGVGGRYCIGFDVQKLKQLAETENLMFQPVEYGLDASLKQAKFAFIQALGELQPDRGLGGSKGQSALHFKAMLKFAPWCKHEAFREEAEWRLAYHLRSRYDPSSRAVSHRIGRSILVPYVAINLGSSSSPISSVMTGPSPHPDLAETSVSSLLWSNNLRSVSISRSKVPFRDW